MGRDWTPSIICRTLSPICILSVAGHYFQSSAVFWIFVMYQLYSWLVWVLLYIYLLCCCCGISVICCNVTNQLTTWNRVLCGIWRDCWNWHSARSRGVTDGIRASGFRFPMLFRYEWLSKQRVHKACRITSLTVVFLECQNYFTNPIWKHLNRILVFSSSLFYFFAYLICFGFFSLIYLSKC